MNMRRRLRGIFAVALSVLLWGCATSTLPYTIAREEILVDYVTNRSRRPVVVVDLDDTIVGSSYTRYVALFFDIGHTDTLPFRQAATSLALIEIYGWNVVFVTARPDILREQTLAWLDVHGFPETPVIFSSSILFAAQSKEEYKTAALGELKRRGLRIEAGVGDKATDIGAYLRHGLRLAFVADDSDDPDIARVAERIGEGDKAHWQEPGTDGAWPSIACWLTKGPAPRTPRKARPNVAPESESGSESGPRPSR